MADLHNHNDGVPEEGDDHPNEGTPLVHGGYPATLTRYLELPTSVLGLERRFLWVTIPFLLGVLADYGDGAVFKAANVQIGFNLGDPYKIAYLFMIYTVMMAIGQPVYSLAKDRSDWPKPLCFSYGLFSLELAIGGASGRNFYCLFAARLVTASGSAGMVFVPNLFLNDVVPINLISSWVAVQRAMALLAQLFGSLLSGSVKSTATLDSWFWGQTILPILALAVLLCKIVFSTERHYATSFQSSPPSHCATSKAETRSSIFSTTLLVLSVGFLCAGLSFIGSQLIFPTWLEYSILGLGVIFLLALVLHQRSLYLRDSTSVLFPKDLDHSELIDLCVLFWVMFFVSGASSALAFVLPWLAKSAALSSAWYLWPFWIGDFIGHVLVAGYAKKYNKVELAITIGAFACCATSGVMYIWWKEMRLLAACLPLICVFGAGFGVVTVGLRPRLLLAFKKKTEYMGKVYTLFHLVITIADLVVTAMSNRLIQNFNPRSLVVNSVGMGDQGIIEERGQEGFHDKYPERWSLTASSTVEDVPIDSLSPVICLVVVTSTIAAFTILCTLKDSELEGKHEHSVNESLTMAPEDNVARIRTISQPF